MGPMASPSWATVFGTWRPSWLVDALVVVVAVAYALGVRRLAGPWSTRRSVAFGAGLAALVVTVDSGIAEFGHGVFAVHMIMHLMLIMVVPALLVAGQPLRLLRDGAPDRYDRVVAGRVARAVTFPLTVLAVYSLVIVLTHLTGFMEAMAGSMTLHHLEQVLYVVAGLLFFLTALGVDAGPGRPSYFARYLLMGVAMGVDTLVGIVLMLNPHSPFPSYALDDIHLGGAIMWVGGDGLMMVIMVVLGRTWVADPSGRVDFGPWLESARRSAFSAQVGGDGEQSADGETSGAPGDLDGDDDRALAAYNRMLARLDRGEHR